MSIAFLILTIKDGKHGGPDEQRQDFLMLFGYLVAISTLAFAVISILCMYLKLNKPILTLVKESWQVSGGHYSEKIKKVSVKEIMLE